jgi:hypothetical protein
MKKLQGICLLLLLCTYGAMAQFPASGRKITAALQDTVRLDTLSIRSETFQFSLKNGD